jgi:mono/diheme cytochrome c family protein
MPGLVVACLFVGLEHAAAMAPDVQRGLNFTKTYCAGCHAIGKVGDSPLHDAPPFRSLHEKYAIEDLAEPFAEGIMTGHPSMPQWRLDPGEIHDLLEYLKSVQDKEP